MKIFFDRLGPFAFIDIFHVLGLSSAICNHTCGHISQGEPGEGDVSVVGPPGASDAFPGVPGASHRREVGELY